MKSLLTIWLAMAMAASAVDWVWTSGGNVETRPGPLPVVWNGAENLLQNATDAQRYALGWRKYVRVEPPDGQEATGWGWTVNAETAVYAPTATQPIPPAPDPQPMLFPAGIDAPYIFLAAQTNGSPWLAVYARSDRTLGVVDGHKSPVDKERLKSKIAADNATNAAVRVELGIADPAVLADLRWMMSVPNPDALTGQSRKRYADAQQKAVRALIKLQFPEVRQ